MNDDLLVVQQVRHHFSDSFGRLSDCCLEVPELRVRRGEFLVVTGPSGSGKSTLLNLIGGFLRPLKGLILKNGKPVTGPGPDRITVFQDHAIFPWYTALENTAYGLRAQGLSRQDAEEKAMEALRTVRLEHSAHLYPAALSGGMRQRVALARALALAPDILLLDEPFASVDETGRSHLREELLRLWCQFGWTIIMVTHDLHEAASLADRIAVLHAPPKGLTSLFDIDEARPRSASVIARIHQDISCTPCSPDPASPSPKEFPMFKRLVALSALALMLFAASAHAADCRLAYNAKVQYAPQVLALQKGWYDDAASKIIGIDLGVSAGIAAAEALVSGSADVAVMGDVPALIALASARPCVLVASYGGGDGMHSIVVSEKSGIKSPGELAGKRIGVQFGSSTHGAVSLYLKTHGLLDSAKLVNVKQNALVEALIVGDIDALAASEPAPSLALKKVPGARMLSNLGGLGNQYPLMMVAAKAFADAHPEALKVLVAGTQKAVDYINSDPVNAGLELSKATGISAAQEQNTLRKLEWKIALDESVLSSLEQTAAFLHSIGKLKKMPDIRAAARPEFTR